MILFPTRAAKQKEFGEGVQEFRSCRSSGVVRGDGGME
jgi:hypothetical protein